MSDSSQRSNAPDSAQDLDLTRSIRRLTVPANSTDSTAADDARANRALLICRDNESKKWGPRWLKQAGLEPIVISDPAAAAEKAISLNPQVIIVDAGLQTNDKAPLYSLLQEMNAVSAPIIVLCPGSRDLHAALKAKVYDVVRKPFEWDLISRRAVHAAKIGGMEAELKDARTSLSEAVDIADLARQKLRSRETFEPVTGLPNKTKFIDLLSRGMSAVDRDQNVLAVLVIGFNRFRLVIEAMGQERANLVITEIGKIVNQCLHEAEMAQTHTHGLRTAAAASIELAKFGLMFTCSADDDDAIRSLQQQVVEKLAQPVQISGQTVHLSACVGIALYPQDANGVDQLLQRADNAMRDAQSRGGGFRFYCEQTDAAAARKLKLENLLHEALDRDELTVAYQPITNTAAGKITGVEALLRWRQGDNDFISPSEFVPIAEDSGMMIRIGEFILDRACRQLEIWRQAQLPLEQICVNVSKAQLMSGSFVQTVARLLRQYNVEPGHLELEISERGVLSGQFDVVNQLHELKNLGVRLSIDDFGTGDSAIAYLRELPVDSLKIDRSYVAGLTTNSKDEALISAMIALGQKLDLKIIAEGVETAEQVEILRKLECDEFQGFYVSAPVSSDEFERLVRSAE